MKTYSPKKTDITRKWYIIDAKNKILGKVAVKAAYLLRGKHKPTFSNHLDCGDHVIIINAKDIAVTGQKMTQKIYYRHSQYPGGLHAESIKDLMAKNPAKLLEKAISGMVPRNRLRNHVLSKLKIYNDDKHANIAQQPIPMEID